MAPRIKDWQENYAQIQMRAAHLYRSHEWVDCKFLFQKDSDTGVLNESLEAHKLILAMASSVFAAMFYGDVGAKESPVLIQDIDLPTFSALLQYIYTDETDIRSTEDAMKLYKAANKYILIHLEKMCLDYLFKELNPSNACQIYEFACFFSQTALEENCLEIFSTKTKDVLKGHSFRNADINTVDKIVSMDTLVIDSELDLYNGLLDYANNFKKLDEDQDLAIQSEKSNKKLCQCAMQRNDEDKISGSPANTASALSTKEFAATRRILHGVIEKIRFLAMTPEDFAKVSESTLLLSVDEIRSLFTNMFSPNSSVPMPHRFSNLREPRIRTITTFSHTVHNVTNIDYEQDYYSPPFCVRNLQWRISAQRYEDYLSLYLDCKAEGLSEVSKDWSCYAKFEIRLLSSDPNTDPLKCSLEHKFSKKESDWGLNMIEWNKLINPDSKFLKDDSITIEVDLKTEPPQDVLHKPKEEKKPTATTTSSDIIEIGIDDDTSTMIDANASSVIQLEESPANVIELENDGERKEIPKREKQKFKTVAQRRLQKSLDAAEALQKAMEEKNNYKKIFYENYILEMRKQTQVLSDIANNLKFHQK